MHLIGLGGEKYSGKNTAAKVLIDNHAFKEYSLARPLKELCAKVFDIPYENLDDPKLKEQKFENLRPVTQDNVYEIVRQCQILIGFEQFKKSEETILRNMGKKVVKKRSMNPVVSQQVQGVSGSQSIPMQFQPPEYKTFETPRQILQFVGTELVRDCISPYFWCKVLDAQIQNQEKVVLTDVRFFEEREYVKIKKGLLIKVERPSETTVIKAKDAHASENSLGSANEYDYLLQNDGSVGELQAALETIFTYESLIANRKIHRIQTQE